MSALIMDDAREYIFPLFLVHTQDNGVFLNSRIFLGTAFFVTRKGDAITANHVVPKKSKAIEDAMPESCAPTDSEKTPAPLNPLSTYSTAMRTSYVIPQGSLCRRLR